MIKTERLLLRRPEKIDLPEFAEMFSEPSVLQHIGNTPLSYSASWARLLRDVGHWSLEGFGQFSVIEKISGKYIGKIGYTNFERDLGAKAQTRIEMSWTFRSHFHGLGYASEAGNAAQEWLDNQRKIRTACIISVRNIASIKLANKLGYMEVDRLDRNGAETLVLIRDC